VLPDRFIDHDKPEAQYAEVGLDAAGVVATAIGALMMSGERVPDSAGIRLPGAG